MNCVMIDMFVMNVTGECQGFSTFEEEIKNE